LWDVLYQARFREASELRDRIYGVLGLVNSWAGANPIVPDYSLPVAEVFCQAALVIIQNTGTLDPLYLKTESPGTPAQEHPSRIPHMSKASDFKYNRHLWVFLRLLSTLSPT